MSSPTRDEFCEAFKEDITTSLSLKNKNELLIWTDYCEFDKNLYYKHTIPSHHFTKSVEEDFSTTKRLMGIEDIRQLGDDELRLLRIKTQNTWIQIMYITVMAIIQGISATAAYFLYAPILDWMIFYVQNAILGALFTLLIVSLFFTPLLLLILYLERRLRAQRQEIQIPLSYPHHTKTKRSVEHGEQIQPQPP